jgi:nucleotide-binding universal stress UspA family protein
MVEGRMTTKRILVPVSETDPSSAVSVVKGVARDQGSTVRLLRVFAVPERVVGPHGRTIAYADQEMERLTATGLAEMELAESDLAGVPVERVVRFGEPVEEILREAEAFDADLIALTTLPRSRLGSAIAPGVSERVFRAAPVPVLLLRG